MMDGSAARARLPGNPQQRRPRHSQRQSSNYRHQVDPGEELQEVIRAPTEGPESPEEEEEMNRWLSSYEEKQR